MFKKLLEILKENNLFLTGGGGVGKSYATRIIIDSYKEQNMGVVVLGSTGISAVNIGGVSVHSFFGFGICKNHEELKAHDKNKGTKRRIEILKEMLPKTDLLVIDEISMVSGALFDMIYLRLVNLGFKGRLLVVGDFYQLPPVSKKEENSLFSAKYAFSSYSWSLMKFVNVEFIHSKRTKDLEFYDVLSKIRVGEIDHKISSYLEQFLLSNFTLNEDKTVLFGRNRDADELNLAMLKRIKSPLESFSGEYEIFDKNLRSERFEKWIENLNVPTVFDFKIGAKIIFTANKYQSSFSQDNYYNGEQGVINEICKNNSGKITSLVILKNSGKIVEIEPKSYDLGEFIVKDGEPIYNVLASFYQFPLRLAYGITIHKSQGMSVENLTCNLNYIFAEGQLYVALSRAVDPKKLTIIYSKELNFSTYLSRSVKVAKEVKEFYETETFIYLD
ncbi:MAG: AAA family ATPase [Campylobacter sp.]|nr:AAA family ATPase [Campylobacter sp.]